MVRPLLPEEDVRRVGLEEEPTQIPKPRSFFLRMSGLQTAVGILEMIIEEIITEKINLQVRK